MTATQGEGEGPDFTPWPPDVAARYRAEGWWADRTLGELVGSWCDYYADRVAFVELDRRWTYAQLAEWVDNVAAGLSGLGLAAGDSVLVHMPNRPHLVVALVAMFRLGLRPVLALPAHQSAEITHLARLSDAKAYLGDGSNTDADVIDAVHAIESIRHLILTDVVLHTAADIVDFGGLCSTGPYSVTRPGPDDIALYLLSGGTTGLPKLIPRTHNDYAYNIEVSAANAELRESSVYLTAIPVAHNFGLGCPGVLGTLSRGGTTVFMRNESPLEAFDLISRHGVTFAALVPPLAVLWATASRPGDRRLASLELVQVGGQRLSDAHAARFAECVPGRLQQSYGMAEGLLSQTRPDDGLDVVCTTQGRPLSPGDEIRVFDRAGQDVADPGAVGELLVRGPYTIRGYYRAAIVNAERFTPDGFFRTGDLVRRTVDGNLVVEGRLTDVINRGGSKISPGEVEEHLRQVDGVADAMVISLPHSFLGEQSCALVVLEPGHVLEAVDISAELARRGVARFKWPDRIQAVDEIPITAAGKRSRARMRAWILDKRSGP